jgi:hypothetical protein
LKIFSAIDGPLTPLTAVVTLPPEHVRGRVTMTPRPFRGGHRVPVEATGVMAMTSGLPPVLTGGRAVLAAVRIGITVPEPLLTT